MWTEHRNPEGRTYWFNTATKQSVWEKPDDLKTPFEKALNQTKWREYFSGGRKYYYNTETKESKWDMPDELLLLLEKVEKEKAMAAAAATNQITGPEPAGTTQGALAPMGGANQSSSASQSTQQNGLAVGHHTGSLPLAPSSVLPARPNLPDDPVIPHNGFPTIEEAEKAFMHLLRKAGVDANWTWDQTMRAIITDPLYKALNTLAEKKACWEKYTNNLRAKEQEEKEARLAKLRPAIRNMLKGNPNVFHYTTFPTADKLFAQHPIWQQARIESERKMIFEEYVTDLKQREVQESRAARARSVQKVMALFKQLNVDVVTRWRTAHQLVTESEEYRLDPELQKLPTLDILLAFEDYSRVREREYEEQMRRTQVEKTRKERKAREAFKDLVQNLVYNGRIKARSKWKEVYPMFRDDERYLSILGNPGSNPLELFWDAVDALDQQLDRKIMVVEDVFKNYGVQEDDVVPDKAKSKGFVIGPETTEEEFNNIVKAHADEATKTLAKEDLYEVYKTLHDAAVKRQADEKRRAERKQRHLQDDLRYAFKKLSDPLDISMSYEQIVPLVEHLPEYKSLDDDEGRRAAWAKYVKRQKEKMREAASEDGASTTSRKRKEPPREHRDERERDKEEKGRDREKDRDRERDRDREKDREYRDRDKERDRERDRNRDYEREGRSSRHHHRYDEPDGHRSSRDHGRERDKDYERDKDREAYRTSKHYRDDDRKRDRDGHRDRKSSRSDYGASYGRDWEEPPRKDERERSASIYDESRGKHEDKHPEERAEKRARLDHGDESMDLDKTQGRAESPEEGEI